MAFFSNPYSPFENFIFFITLVLDSKDHSTTMLTAPPVQRGKAPPIKPFTGESSSVHWDNWLPILEQAATWNSWNEQEKWLDTSVARLRGNGS